MYIGQTIFDVTTRWKSHITTPRNLIGRAIQKYGSANFEFFEICTASAAADLNFLEEYFIKHYQSCGQLGYNLTSGGDASAGKFKLCVRRKMSESKRGKTHHITAINVVDVSTNQAYNFSSLKEACKKFGISRSSILKSCKSGLASKGYLFSYANQSGSKKINKFLHAQRLGNEPTSVEYNLPTSPRQPSKYETLKNSIIKLYNESNSSYVVAKELNLDKSHICRYLKKWGKLRSQNEAASNRNSSRYKIEESLIYDLKQQYALLKSFSKVSQKMGLSIKTVTRAIKG